MIIKVIQVLLPQIKATKFFDAVDFRELVTRHISKEHFEESQYIVINEKYLNSLEERFRTEAEFRFNTKETNLHQAFEKLSSFTLKDVKYMEDEWNRIIQIQTNIPNQEDSDSSQGRSSFLSRASIIGRGSFLSQSTVSTKPLKADIEIFEFQKIWSDSFSVSPLKKSICKEIDYEQLYETFRHKETGKINFK